MINKSEVEAKQTIFSRVLLDGYRDLLITGTLDQTSSPFVNELKDIKLNEDELMRLKAVGTKILFIHNNQGFGYLSSSSNFDRLKELRAAYYIAQCFREKDNPAQPVIVPVDSFYRFVPGNASFVQKTQIFGKIAQEQNPNQDFALVLSGFSDSVIFTEETLNQIPTQDNAGMNIQNTNQFGRDLLEFAIEQLQLLIEETDGDLNLVLQKIIEISGAQKEDVQLLLVTGLLLQDRQIWQDLWGENTLLYIVAPMYFHDAMNRLNLTWGHGSMDYRRRASSSLLNKDKPLLEDNIQLKNYHDGGLSQAEFERRIEPILRKLKK